MTYKYLFTKSSSILSMLKSSNNIYKIPLIEASLICETFIHINLSLIDVTKSYNLLLKQEEKDDKLIAAKGLIIHLSEFISDMGKIVGRKLSSWKMYETKSTEIENDIRELRKAYAELKKMSKEIYTLRNTVAAHKDKDINLFLKGTTALSKVDFEGIILDVLKFMLRFSIIELYILDAIVEDFERRQFGNYLNI